ncbi:sensor histidine kinase [Terrabacter terrigena]|uniref:Sensor histidine kinase n=1 Tax=Terrabacter terrigena TaxID=574718 RepID=A0ABW3MUC5_9MICO
MALLRPADPLPDGVRRSALRRFLLWTLAALVLVGVGTVLLARPLASQIALRDAAVRGSGLARAVVAPLVDRHVRAGEPGPTGTLDYLLRSRMKDGSIVHMKIWTQEGRVLWSDETDLVGDTFPLDPDVAELFGSENVTAAVSDLSKAENAEERGSGELLEVYAGLHDAEGVPLVFESYWTADPLHEDEAALLGRLALLGLGSLILFAVMVLPLAVSLARRVERGEADRSTMLGHALSASDLERRRIADDLHDGVLQDLAGFGYLMGALVDDLPREATRARSIVGELSSGLKRDAEGLRSLMTDIYPADLAEGGLVPAVEWLADHARASGLDVEVDLDPALDRSGMPMVQVVYRSVREGLRNVLKHAEASSVLLRARVVGHQVVVTVRDDGIGPRDPAGLAARVRPVGSGQGHVGLHLLRDTVRDLGGELVLGAADGGGALLTVTLPEAFADTWVAREAVSARAGRPTRGRPRRAARSRIRPRG